MSYLIESDKYFSFRESPNKGNIINSITGKYATGGGTTRELIKTFPYAEFPKTENPLSSKKPNKYDFPDSITFNIKLQLTQEQISKYNKGFRYEIWILKAKVLRKILFSEDSDIFYITKDDAITADFNAIKDDDYVKFTNGFLDVKNGWIDSAETFNNIINLPPKDKMRAYNAYTYFFDFTKTFNQEFTVGYKIKIYGVKEDLEFTNNFAFNGKTGDEIFNVDLENNELLTLGSKYKNVDLANHIANRIFENYKYGRATAELEWIGNPSVKVGDVVTIESKKNNSISEEYFIYGKECSFNGGYGEKLYLIAKSKSKQLGEYINKGLILYVDGINRDKSQDGNWKDLSGNNNNFDINAASPDSWNNDSFHCDGFTFPITTSSLAGSQKVTFEACFSINEISGIIQYICGNLNNGGYSYYINKNGFICSAIQDGNTITEVELFKAELNKKYFLSTVIDSNANLIAVYSNGVLIKSKAFYNGLRISPNSFAIGGKPTGNEVIQEDARLGYEFVGNIYAVRVYNSTNSDVEVYNNYEIDKERFK